MRWLLLGVAVAGLVLILWGVRIEDSGGSADERVGAVIPWTVGAVLLAVDFALLIVAVVRRWF